MYRLGHPENSLYLWFKIVFTGTKYPNNMFFKFVNNIAGVQVYCSAEFAFLEQLVTYLPTDGHVTILDAGANVGLASLLFDQITRYNSVVLSVDAMPDTCDVLIRNTRASGRIFPLHAAIVAQNVADTTPTLNFSGPGKQFWGFKVEHDFVDYESRVVNVVPTASLASLLTHVRSYAYHEDL